MGAACFYSSYVLLFFPFVAFFGFLPRFLPVTYFVGVMISSSSYSYYYYYYKAEDSFSRFGASAFAFSDFAAIAEVDLATVFRGVDFAVF